MRTTFLICSFILTTFFSYSHNQTTSLIEASTLYENRNHENYLIIDLRKPEKFNAGHIPNAINIWRSDIIDQNKIYGGMMAKKAIIEQLFSSLGIKSDEPLLIYDDKGLVDAIRLWWILDYYGHTNVKLLNGGLNSWKNSDYPITTKNTILKKTTFKFKKSTINASRYANIEDVKNAISNPDILLLDTRELKEFTGEFIKKGAFRAGKIPNSIWCNWSETVDYKNSTKFKSLDKLKEIYTSRGITPDKDIIAYCQSGVRSAHTTFVLTQLLGFTSVKNYDGSWIEWSYNKDLPIETGIEKAAINPQRKLHETKKSYQDIFVSSFKNYAKYVWSEMSFKVSSWYVNYFWLLIILSLIVWILEIIFPWRKNQPIIRKDFFIDTFYMFFNFFIFKVIIFFAFSVVIEKWFSNLIGGIDKLIIYDTSQLHPIIQLIVFFVALDFIQWFTHTLLHRFDFLWQFHKVHHSVEEMGYGAHLRFHWMENIFYTPMKFLIMMVIGNFSPENAFVVYYISIAIGHLNHANIGISYGIFKYIINNPKMHIWHHAHHLPEGRKNGVNFGISLSIWDYIFKTAYIPKDGRDIKIGFEGLTSFPKGFIKQFIYGFIK